MNGRPHHFGRSQRFTGLVRRLIHAIDLAKGLADSSDLLDRESVSSHSHGIDAARRRRISLGQQEWRQRPLKSRESPNKTERAQNDFGSDLDGAGHLNAFLEHGETADVGSIGEDRSMADSRPLIDIATGHD